MHSIIPHHHSSQVEECVKSVEVEEYSLLSFLTEAFHLDLGDENHLENYSGSSHDFSLQHFTTDQVWVFQESVVNTSPCTDYRKFAIVKPPRLKCATHRGPPFAAHS